MENFKTYCISDVHGHYENLKKFIDTLNENDKVYVLGDVIDKGDDSIKALECIMNDQRFTMMLGNHEYMMFTYLDAYIGSPEKKAAYEAWVKWNDGGNTLAQYEALPKYKRIRVLNYLRSIPLNFPLIRVNDKEYCLVHSCPHDNITYSIETLNKNDIKISSYVWDRVDLKSRFEWDGPKVIAGHTPVQFYNVQRVRPMFFEDSIEEAKYIDIDGGLATGLASAKLIALCLDDLSYQLY